MKIDDIQIEAVAKNHLWANITRDGDAFVLADFRHPGSLRLEWDGGDATGGARTVYTVEVRRRPDGTPVFRADTVGTSVEVDNLEIGHVDFLKDAAFIKVYYTLGKGENATIDNLVKAKDFVEQ